MNREVHVRFCEKLGGRFPLLTRPDLMAVPVKKTILELKQIKLADYRERVKNRTGRWRELYLRECESLESAIWELQNEQEAH
jgi:hypothetical protein